MLARLAVPLCLLIGAATGLGVVTSFRPPSDLQSPGGDMQSSPPPEVPLVRDDSTVRASSPWNEAYFTNTPVVTHDGRRLRFYDDLIKDKIVVVNFIYTSCTDVCSLTTARLDEVRRLLGDRVGRDIFFYSISLDPVVDGPEVLNTYADHFYNGPGWLFLTGEPEHIDLIRHKLGERSSSRELHRNDVMLGNDRTGEWGRDSIFTDVAQLAWNISRMDPHSRDGAFIAAEFEAKSDVLMVGNTPGQALFAKTCASCHSIGGGDKVGPDLADVEQRRDRAWLDRFIISPRDMVAAKDPTALGLVESYGGLVMPTLGLNATDVGDVLAYIRARSPGGDNAGHDSAGEGRAGEGRARVVKDTLVRSD